MNEVFNAVEAEELASLEPILTKVLVAAEDQITVARLAFDQTGEKRGSGQRPGSEQ